MGGDFFVFQLSFDRFQIPDFQISSVQLSQKIDYKPLRNMIMRWWTTIQSFATRLRQNQANNDITTKQGLSTGATTTHTNQQPNQELRHSTLLFLLIITIMILLCKIKPTTNKNN
ncbi:hypothetical protein H5410_045980 [Solanum commersonii]|uniref:Uncharacterized protein n=1 Tax=Solanum commersonii TaxID=4109 RepID=A0A9J5XCU3_SOLCO|nr:hypothetical protein H5410_045980 [Solanum commersonii]